MFCRARRATLMISVVIPTYNEAAVIEETLRRAAASLRRPGQDFELIVVDDSSGDGTAELAESLSDELTVRVLRRPGRLGLATAVIDGWNVARGDVLGVMDADLQHPPEVLSSLAEAIREDDVDIVVASRYIAGGGTSQWSWLRRFMSKGATHLATCVLPLTLADVSDPMSGMFFVRASAISGVRSIATTSLNLPDSCATTSFPASGTPISTALATAPWCPSKAPRSSCPPTPSS